MAKTIKTQKKLKSTKNPKPPASPVKVIKTLTKAKVLKAKGSKAAVSKGAAVKSKTVKSKISKVVASKAKTVKAKGSKVKVSKATLPKEKTLKKLQAGKAKVKPKIQKKSIAVAVGMKKPLKKAPEKGWLPSNFSIKTKKTQKMQEKSPKKSYTPKATSGVKTSDPVPSPASFQEESLPEVPEGETLVGTVTHYYPNLGVIAVSVSDQGEFKIGDMIHIRGSRTDFKQRVESLEIDHQPVTHVLSGQSVGIEVNESVSVQDYVYRVNR